MVTLGNNDYVLSPQVIAHEIVHQWYGDQVSPSDWRDVWLNEGMTMLMQWVYEDEHGLRPLRQSVRLARSADQQLRDEYGPPGAYDPRQFGSSNIYYTPALMWNELRVELGDDEFFAIARSWLADQRQHLGDARADLRPLGEGDRARAVGVLRPLDHGPADAGARSAAGLSRHAAPVARGGAGATSPSWPPTS